VADEHVIFDRHPFADKTVRRNLAVTADARALLDLDKRAEAGTVANLTAVQIYEMMI
jgi:hypothetical protein